MIEKRAYKRFPVKVQGGCVLPDRPPTFFSVTIINISAGGLSFVSSVKVEEGQGIDLQIEWGESHALQIKATVIWTHMLTERKQYYVGARIFDTPVLEYEKFVEFYFLKVLSLPESQRI